LFFLRLAKLPGSEESIRICLHVGALQRFHRGDNELNARFILKVFEFCFQFAATLRAMTLAWSTTRPLNAG
jgi:hypothetical protein